MRSHTSNQKSATPAPPTFFCSFVFMSTAYSSLVTSHSSTRVWMCSTDLEELVDGRRGGGGHRECRDIKV